MTGANGDIAERFARACEEARLKAGRLADLVGRSNTPTVGAYREAFIRETIREYLPEGLEAGSGYVRSPEGELSKQLDVVVYETGRSEPPFAEGGFVVAEAEGVRAVVEVKSQVARGSFLQALGELSRVKSWVPLGPKNPPLYAAIATFKAASPGALMRAAQGYYAGRLPNWPSRSRCEFNYYAYKYRVVDLVSVLGGWCLLAGCLPWPVGPAGENDFDIPALASLDTRAGGADASLHLLVSGLLAHLHDFAGHTSPEPLASSYAPLSLSFLHPAVAILGDLSAVEPGFLARHDSVFRHKGLRLDLPRRLIVQDS